VRTIILLVTLTLFGCTIRIEPLKPKVKYVYRSQHHNHKTHPHHAAEKPLSGELVPEGDVKLIEPQTTPSP
jgi:hypothetical protein